MSHDTIDPRPEQYNATFPYETTCLFPAKQACLANGGTSCAPCNWQVGSLSGILLSLPQLRRELRLTATSLFVERFL